VLRGQALLRGVASEHAEGRAETRAAASIPTDEGKRLDHGRAKKKLVTPGGLELNVDAICGLYFFESGFTARTSASRRVPV
jgi:hypothetical protein